MRSLFYKFITLSLKQIIGCENAKGVKFATILVKEPAQKGTHIYSRKHFLLNFEFNLMLMT